MSSDICNVISRNTARDSAARSLIQMQTRRSRKQRKRWAALSENVSLRSEKSNLRTEFQRSEREKRSNKRNAQLADSIELLRTALDSERAARNRAEAQLQMSAHAMEKRQWLRNTSWSLENESGNAE